jgi:hypothetical protein
MKWSNAHSIKADEIQTGDSCEWDSPTAYLMNGILHTFLLEKPKSLEYYVIF